MPGLDRQILKSRKSEPEIRFDCFKLKFEPPNPWEVLGVRHGPIFCFRGAHLSQLLKTIIYTSLLVRKPYTKMMSLYLSTILSHKIECQYDKSVSFARINNPEWYLEYVAMYLHRDLHSKMSSHHTHNASECIKKEILSANDFSQFYINNCVDTKTLCHNISCSWQKFSRKVVVYSNNMKIFTVEFEKMRLLYTYTYIIYVQFFF